MKVALARPAKHKEDEAKELAEADRQEIALMLKSVKGF